jgi:hypothetical protein
VKANTSQTPIGTATVEIKRTGIPVYPLLNDLTFKIQRKHTSMAFALLAATHHRSSDKFWKFYSHSN